MSNQTVPGSRGPGRPRMLDAVRCSANLTPTHVELARQLGHGNVSQGIRRAIEALAAQEKLTCTGS